MTQEEKLREEWGKTEVSKRIFDLEAFAQNHGWSGWQGETIQDWWLSKMAEHHRKCVESVWKEVEKIKIPVEGIKKRIIRSYESYNQAIDDILSLPSLSITNRKVCGALIHTRGLDGKGLYCAAEKPCKLHSKSK